ncbi:MAG: Cell death protease [Trizodia sp. TS-e1964]|nr:MAG: Cell death protease [Trizodia sp. TS-e1964]
MLGIGILSVSLLPAAVLADKCAADYFVHSLPGQPEGPLLKMHAGHIEILPEHHGNLFFWHFQNRHIAKRQQTVIWLNGGPGCSSMDGALMEIGPYRLKDESNLRYNDGSWDEFANLLFVDNPLGTGFSYVDTDSYVKELHDMASQFIAFLEKWFKIFPEYTMDDIYIAGESYAGQHIPYIAQAILERNKNAATPWNIKGLLIGNGWVAPTEQYMAYLTFAYKHGLVQEGTDIAKQLDAQQAVCIKMLNENNGSHHIDLPQCESILQELLRLTKKIGGDGVSSCTNMYDIRLTDTYPSCGMSWPPDLKYLNPYLRRRDVLEALHINSDKKTGWTECNGQVSSAFTAKNSKPTIEILPDLLQKMRVVLFSGDQDLICNHIGTEELIHNMEWNGGKGFELNPGEWAPRRDWVFENEAAGLYQEARNLTYVLFYNSSHMVPFDYPRRTRDMLDRFLEVDIATIGGAPADSRIDGEKGLETSVGGHPNSTIAENEEKEKLRKATWAAYYKSGEVALVIVIIAAGAWGWYVWKDRRKRAGYTGLFGGSAELTPEHIGSNGAISGMGLESFRRKNKETDLEAGDFDESELDNLHPESSRYARNGHLDEDRYSVGRDSDDEDEAETPHRKSEKQK